MSISSLFPESVLTIFEKFAFSQNKEEFINNLPAGLEKNILTVLSMPYDLNLRNKMFEAGVPSSLVNEIIDRKLYEIVQGAKNAGEIQQIIADLKKSHLNFFNPSKPNQSIGEVSMEIEKGLQQNKKGFSSKISQEQFQNIEQYVTKVIKTDPNSIYQFSDYAIRNIPEQFLLNLRKQHIQFILNKFQLISKFNEVFVGNLMKKYSQRLRQGPLKSNYEIPSGFYSSLPTSHINILPQYVPFLKSSTQYLKIWFSSNYQKRYPILTTNNQLLAFSQKQEKRKILLQAIQNIQKLQKCFAVTTIKKQIQKQLLVLDLSLQDPNLKRLQHYLQTSNQVIGVMSQSWRAQLKNSGIINNPVKILNRLPSYNLNLFNFIQQYITGLLRKYDPSQYKQIDEILMKYIDHNRYRRLRAKALLTKGCQDSQNVLSDIQKLNIRQQKQLTICQSNKNAFKVYQDVIIKVKVKNVEKIFVKIYQLNLQKHYIENKNQISQDMQLHFLDPTHQFQFQIKSKNPFKEQIFDLKIEEIKKQRGIYIIDFDGQGISSRAIIRKGCISCLRKITLAGLVLKFYDQSGKKIDNLRIWMKGQYFNVKQSYTIPFAQNQQQLTLIAIYQNYAEMITFKIPRESYKLQMKVFYNYESFIVGGKAKIILNPRLYINSNEPQGQTPLSLKLLQNFRINVQTTDFQNIKSVISYENVSLSYEEDYIIEIPIQNYLKNVLISGSGEVKKYNKTNQELSFSQNISIGSALQQNSFKDFYLNKRGQNYILRVLGMNGQNLPCTLVTVTIQMSWINPYSKIYNLESDENGQINLGPLKFVKKVVIQQKSKQWNINSLYGSSEMLSNMNFKQGQKIIIPLPHTNYKIQIANDLNLFLTSQGVNVENLNKLVRINQKFIEIQGLNSGVYRLSILSLYLQVNIIVYRGKQWENPHQIYNQQNSSIHQFIRSSNHFLNLDDPLISNFDQQNKQIKIKILKPQGVTLKDNVKAHIFFYSFIPNRTAPNQVVQVQKLDMKLENIKRKTNTYMSNKKLSQQAAYILNRKNQKQFIGNNLQKPHILLNTIKVRDTLLKQEQMKSQNPYSRVVSTTPFQNAPRFTPSIYANQRLPNPLYSDILTHNNFLKYPGLIIQNIKSQIISFLLPKYYNFFTVLLVSNDSEITRSYSIQQSLIKVKKISHTGLPKQKNLNQAWSMSRQVYSFSAQQSKRINRTSKWCAVSLFNIISFAKTQGVSLDDWVQKWGSYSWDKKLSVYNKKVCHELNSYIKHQDQQFFTKVVSPYIKNKINKTLVDFCLLQSVNCQKWVPIQYFQQLNIFEKILLIQYLIKKQRHRQAQNLVKSLQLKQKSKKYNDSFFKQKFDTMLSAQVNPSPSYLPPSLPPPPPSMMGYLPPPPLPPPAMGGQMCNFSAPGAGFGGGLFGNSAPPPPPPPPSFGAANVMNAPPAMFSMAPMLRMRGAPISKPMLFDQQQQQMLDQNVQIQHRSNYVQQFKQMQRTQEFTEITYDQVKNPNQINSNFIKSCKFWSDLALYMLNKKQNIKFSQFCFITQSIIYLQDKRSFTLAASFLPKNLNPDYQISTQQDDLVIKAKKPFLLFIKQIKLVPYALKNGILLNHRFFDEFDKYLYQQDGTQIQKQVDEFVRGKKYELQTLITNTTGNRLQIQLLIDIPEDSIPLRTKQYTQIISLSIQAYTTKSFERSFYFPNQGQFNFYPANACWAKKVIAKAPSIPKILVKAKRQNKKLDNFLDIINDGQTQDILKYIGQKNIFDQKFFKPHQILWMLRDKQRFQQIIHILRQKRFYHTQIWRFGFLHNDLQAIKQFLVYTKNKNPFSQTLDNTLKIFEYYPYYSSRVHKYSNQNKSKIRNVEFKQTFYKFLFEEIAYFKGAKKTNFKLVFAYFLLLQDRIDEASLITSGISQQQKAKYKLQFDYLQCFLNIYEGFPNFTKARKIVAQYKNYPITKWKAYFAQVQQTLKNYDNDVYILEEQKKIEYKTSVYNEGSQLRISIPQNNRVEVFIYSINIQLLFSQNPFQQVKLSSCVKAAKTIIFQAGQSRQQKLKRQKEFKDVIVEIFESGKNVFLRKIDSILWTNPNLKVKVNEKKGSLQVFYQNKAIPGSYCKVYSKGAKGQKFYRDGYTDITGTFKYALSQLKNITQFSVLTLSQYGGVVSRVAPPSSLGQIIQT